MVSKVQMPDLQGNFDSLRSKFKNIEAPKMPDMSGIKTKFSNFMKDMNDNLFGDDK